jgi:hypothetical protein
MSHLVSTKLIKNENRVFSSLLSTPLYIVCLMYIECGLVPMKPNMQYAWLQSPVLTTELLYYLQTPT